MIRLFGKLYWSIVYTFLPGPAGAKRPILIILEDDYERATGKEYPAHLLPPV